MAVERGEFMNRFCRYALCALLLLLAGVTSCAQETATPPQKADVEDPFNAQWRQMQLQAFRSGLTSGAWTNPPVLPKTPSSSSQGSTGTAAVPPANVRPAQKKPVYEDLYVLNVGTILPALLVTGLNSDLPGYMIAQVSENVFDSETGQKILVPQGTRLFGEYSSQVVFGQKRPMIRWQRLIFPDGSTLDLDGMPGTDKSGYSGLKARVNNHFMPMIFNAVMLSIFSGVASALEDEKNGNSITINQPTITLSDAVPVGAVILFAGKTAPTDWHILDGSLVASADVDSAFMQRWGTAKKNFDKMNHPSGYVWCIKTKSAKQTLMTAVSNSGFSSANANIRDHAGRYIGAELAEVLGNMAQKLFDAQMNRQPTLVVKQGYRFNVIVNKQVRLPEWRKR